MASRRSVRASWSRSLTRVGQPGDLVDGQVDLGGVVGVVEFGLEVLEPEPKPGERRAQLVRGVGDERPLLIDHRGELAGHARHRVGQLAQLGRALRVASSASTREVAAAEPAGGVGEPAERQGDRTGDQPADQGDGGEHDGRDGGESPPEPSDAC